MVLTVSFVLSPVIGFLVTVISRFFSQDLTPASRRQDHTTSPSASQRPRQKRRPRPPHPVPTSVTIAKRPSVWDGMARLLNLIWGKLEAEYFLNRGWTPKPQNCPSGKSLKLLTRHGRACPACPGHPRLRALDARVIQRQDTLRALPGHDDPKGVA